MSEKNEILREGENGEVMDAADFGGGLVKMAADSGRGLLDVRSLVEKIIAAKKEAETPTDNPDPVAARPIPPPTAAIPHLNVNSYGEIPENLRSGSKAIHILIEGGPGKKSVAPEIYEGETGPLRRLYDEAMEEYFAGLEKHPEFKGIYLPLATLKGFRRNNVCWAEPRGNHSLMLEERFENMDSRLNSSIVVMPYSSLGPSLGPANTQLERSSLLETGEGFDGHKALLLAPVQVNRKWAAIYFMMGLQSLMRRLFEKKVTRDTEINDNYKIGLTGFLAADYITDGGYRQRMQEFLDSLGLKTPKQVEEFLVKCGKSQIETPDSFISGTLIGDDAHSMRERNFRNFLNIWAMFIQVYFKDRPDKYSLAMPPEIMKAYGALTRVNDRRMRPSGSRR